MQLVRNFLGEELRREEKTQLVPAFFAAYLGNCGGAAWCYIEGGWERIIFDGEDGSIIKENFEFVKNGKKNGQKGQGWIFVMLNIRKIKKDLLTQVLLPNYQVSCMPWLCASSVQYNTTETAKCPLVKAPDNLLPQFQKRKKYIQ